MARIISKILFLLFIPVIGYGQNFFWSHNYSLDTIPTMYTNSASSITNNSAVLGGDVFDDGGDAITEKGIVWSVNTAPTVLDNKVIMGSGMGSFSQEVSGFACGTKIYFRSYAINSIGVGYGPQNSFTPSSLLLNEVWLANSVTSDCGTINITSLTTARAACADWNNLLCDNRNAPVEGYKVRSVEVDQQLYYYSVDCTAGTITDGYYLIMWSSFPSYSTQIVQVASRVITYVENCE